MTRFRLEVRVVPRPGLLDPEGKAILSALHSLDYEDVRDVRVGKLLYLYLDADSGDQARGRADAMCERLLANPVTEDFQIEVLEETEETASA